MEANVQRGLQYTDDFRVACVINDLKEEDVLQYLINRSSFYAFNGGDMETVSLFATAVVMECKESQQAKTTALTERREQLISLKYISMLSELNQESGLSAVERMRQSFQIMKDWDNHLSGQSTEQRIFEIDDQRVLVLSFDFNLLCKVNGVTPKQVLQHFINNISMARSKAMNLPGKPDSNASNALFTLLRLSRSVYKSWKPLLMDIYDWYTDQLVTLDEGLKNEINVEVRLSQYASFYSEWYSTMVKNVN